MTKAEILMKYHKKQYREQLKRAMVLIKRLGIKNKKAICVSPYSKHENIPLWMSFCLVKPYSSSYEELYSIVEQLVKDEGVTMRQSLIATEFQKFHINWLERWEFETGYNVMGRTRMSTIWKEHADELF